MEKSKEHFTMVQRGESSKNIIGCHVYSCQSYGSRIDTDTRGYNTGNESIRSEDRVARQLTHY